MTPEPKSEKKAKNGHNDEPKQLNDVIEMMTPDKKYTVHITRENVALFAAKGYTFITT